MFQALTNIGKSNFLFFICIIFLAINLYFWAHIVIATSLLAFLTVAVILMGKNSSNHYTMCRMYLVKWNEYDAKRQAARKVWHV